MRTKKNHVVQRQVQHRLHLSPRNFGTNFHTKSAQHLVANHLFKLPHAFHFCNNQGKKETIDTLLMVGDINTWWKVVVNELGRLANFIDNWVRATNTI